MKEDLSYEYEVLINDETRQTLKYKFSKENIDELIKQGVDVDTEIPKAMLKEFEREKKLLGEPLVKPDINSIKNIQQRIRYRSSYIKKPECTALEKEQIQKELDQLWEQLKLKIREFDQLSNTVIDESPADKPQLIEDIRGGTRL